jgi:3-mercaptopyruvate sulfurtransferase SseA
VALRLRGLGINRVRPLAGGLQAWKDLDFPMERIEDQTPAA